MKAAEESWTQQWSGQSLRWIPWKEAFKGYLTEIFGNGETTSYDIKREVQARFMQFRPGSISMVSALCTSQSYAFAPLNKHAARSCLQRSKLPFHVSAKIPVSRFYSFIHIVYDTWRQLLEEESVFEAPRVFICISKEQTEQVNVEPFPRRTPLTKKRLSSSV